MRDADDDTLVAEQVRLRKELEEPRVNDAMRLRELLAIDDELQRRDDARLAAQLERFVKIHEAMLRLRELTPGGLIAAAPGALGKAGGFTRTMISEVRGSVWDPRVLWTVDGIDPRVGEVQAAIERMQIPLERLLVETELVRRRRPSLVTNPTSSPFNDLVRWTSYVVAPVMPAGRVIGFLHADRFGHRECDETDRELVWSFAEHFGLLFERAVLIEQLESRRTRLRTAFADAAGALDELSEAELALARRGPLAVPSTPADRDVSLVDALLTRRERDVLDILVSGATNADVAARLTLAEGTVKSHLKRILRKLHVTNRAEAAAKYLHLQRLEAERRR